MKLERVFNVLVLGGAAQFTGCAEEAPPALATDAAAAGGAEMTMPGNDNSEPDSGEALQTVDGREAGEPTVQIRDAGPAANGGLDGAMMMMEPPELDCTLGASQPADALGMPCGCDCCWAPTLNTDATACASFCGDCCDT